MKYYLDTEFLEGTQKTFFGKTKPTIDLISIGIVAEDGREYYAVSKDFNLKEAWNRYDIVDYELSVKKVYWIRENVLKPIFNEMLYQFNPAKHDIFDRNIRKFSYKNFKYLLGLYGKSNKNIAEEVYDFCITYDLTKSVKDNNPEFYTYYGDYDWVVFCWLFGKMIDLPKGFPMYSKDLKKLLDETIDKKQWNYFEHILECDYHRVNNTKDRPATFDEKLKKLKAMPSYPKQPKYHNALSDARWNFELHKFLDTI